MAKIQGQCKNLKQRPEHNTEWKYGQGRHFMKKLWHTEFSSQGSTEKEKITERIQNLLLFS